jgi:cytochrome P450
VQADPDPVYAELRTRTAVARTPLGAAVLRRDDVHRLLSDTRLVTALPHLVRFQGVADGPLQDMLAATVLAMDGADHTRLRRLVSRSFTPRAADRHRPRMRALVEELVERLPASQCEFVADFADHYPVRVICEVLGVPPEDHHLFARWGDVLTYVLSLELSTHLQEVEEAAAGLSAYVDRLVADRQARPRDDLVTSLVQASEEGDRLSAMELRAMIGGLLFAGFDTTRNQLGQALFAFCQHPEQWEILARNVPRPAPLRHHRRPASAPHLRWRAALLPRRQPRPGRDGGGAPNPAGTAPQRPTRRRGDLASGDGDQWAHCTPPRVRSRLRPSPAGHVDPRRCSHRRGCGWDLAPTATPAVRGVPGHALPGG